MEIQKIKIEKISASPLNPRKTFDEVAIEELAANIEKQGLLQPITVRPTSEAPYLDEDTGEVINVKDTYEIVCGATMELKEGLTVTSMPSVNMGST